MNRRLVAGNWKMHGDLAMAVPLIAAAGTAAMRHTLVDVVICPPAPLLYPVGNLLQDSPLALGAQDCHTQSKGAHTGNVSAPMLKEAGCQYVIVGHSERRAEHRETDEEVQEKADIAIKYGLIPIVCVGESVDIRDAGRAIETVTAQAQRSIPTQKGDFVLAYEPVWAIGSGRVPEASDIAAMHAALKDIVGAHKVLYGGSVKADNARGILAIAGVDGVLVGGASLDADAFAAIIAAADIQKI